MGNFIFSQHFHFLVKKFNIFSTFGSNQDDHDKVQEKGSQSLKDESTNLKHGNTWGPCWLRQYARQESTRGRGAQ